MISIGVVLKGCGNQIAGHHPIYVLTRTNPCRGSGIFEPRQRIFNGLLMSGDNPFIAPNLRKKRDGLRRAKGEIPAWAVLLFAALFPNRAQLGSVWQLAVEKVFEGVAVHSAGQA